jgi:exodeoxyribonuclease III
MKWKLATFNVNGVRSRQAVLLAWVAQNMPDALCLQEIKCQEPDFPVGPFAGLGYVASIFGQKSFNGVAILTREEPQEVLRGFGDGGPDEEARLIAVKVNGIWVVNTYVPQGRDPEHPKFQVKLGFFERLGRWLDGRFSPQTPLVWTGDINVAPEDIDVFSPERMKGKIGFHPDERKALEDVKAWGLTDLFRKHHPEEKQFTFWDYRLPQSFARNLGWRLDHILATEPLARISTDCRADPEPRGAETPSDHTPVWAEFELDELPVSG